MAYGRPFSTDYVSKGFPKFIKGDSLPPIQFHDLRHTHATELLKTGVHLKTVSERPGYSEIRTTLDTDFHFIPTLQREAAEQAANKTFTPIGEDDHTAKD